MIRPAREEDARPIAEVHVRSWLKAYRGLIPDHVLDRLSVEERAAWWRQAIRRPTHRANRIWVMERHGQVMGFCSTEPTRDEDEDPATVAEVTAIYLEPEAWGQGFGRALFRHAVEALRAQGFKTATLWVLEGNVRTRLFYEAAGWRTDDAVQEEPMTGQKLPEVRYRKALEGG